MNPFIVIYFLYYYITINFMEKLSHYFVLDIGGTLAKLCFLSAQQTNIPHIPSLTIKIKQFNAYFNMFKQNQDCFSFLDKYLAQNDDYNTIALTGGGSFKYRQKFESYKKKIVIVKQFQSLIQGLHFFQNYSVEQFIVTTFVKNADVHPTQNVSFSEIKRPLLIVNVGSGVSIIKIIEEQKKFACQRVGGTSLGGGYLMGLSKLLLNETSFTKILELAKNGKNQSIDFVPADFNNVPSELLEAQILISLGKLNKQSKKQDIARSLFFMVAFNIAQIALMYSDIYRVQDVIFTGFFCRNNNFVLQCFAEAFSFFQNTKQSQIRRVYSLKHDGYLGTIGCLHSLLANGLKQNIDTS